MKLKRKDKSILITLYWSLQCLLAFFAVRGMGNLPIICGFILLVSIFLRIIPNGRYLFLSNTLLLLYTLIFVILLVIMILMFGFRSTSVALFGVCLLNICCIIKCIRSKIWFGITTTSRIISVTTETSWQGTTQGLWKNKIITQRDY